MKSRRRGWRAGLPKREELGEWYKAKDRDERSDGPGWELSAKNASTRTPHPSSRTYLPYKAAALAFPRLRRRSKRLQCCTHSRYTTSTKSGVCYRVQRKEKPDTNTPADTVGARKMMQTTSRQTSEGRLGRAGYIAPTKTPYRQQCPALRWLLSSGGNGR